MQTIYCYDDKYKEQLIKDGFKFISFQIIDNKSCWLFENNKYLKFDRQVNKKLIYF